MKNKIKVSSLLRKLRLLHPADILRFKLERAKNKQTNKEFLKSHPDVKLPPDYLIYESHNMSYSSYFYNGKKDAAYFKSIFEKYVPLKDAAILDWGCGPGRIIRHLPDVIGNGCSYYGTDYNEKSIDWCTENLPEIHFNKNELTASLPYEDNFFEALYGVSIFTHLSEAMHHAWFDELYRVLKPGGVMLLTTQGDVYKAKLNKTERQQYETGNLVVRGDVVEGHRVYSAFQPKPFMQKLFKNVEILEHIEMPIEKDWYPQDQWVVRK
jgi:ubiquinone/menaquinone biosynthesis C-methylase UbiE|tara:strand:- start:40924 stop:41724 length:801 start_codon:yes stop_codon:yes gene_type:complete